MLQITLDTSFLITFATPDRKNHAAAVEYFRHCVTNKIPMWVSAIAAGEFEIKQRFIDLPLQNFRIQPYNLPHALRAATFHNQIQQLNNAKAHPADTRVIIINDLKIIAQAEEENIPLIITEDENTLLRMANRLRQAGHAKVNVILLKEGFSPDRLKDPNQGNLNFPADITPAE